jgi:hypothetical protein
LEPTEHRIGEAEVPTLRGFPKRGDSTGTGPWLGLDSDSPSALPLSFGLVVG